MGNFRVESTRQPANPTRLTSHCVIHQTRRHIKANMATQSNNSDYVDAHCNK